MREKTRLLRLAATAASYKNIYIRATPFERFAVLTIENRLKRVFTTKFQINYIQKINQGEKHLFVFGIYCPPFRAVTLRQKKIFSSITKDFSESVDNRIQFSLTYRNHPTEGTFLLYKSEQCFDMVEQLHHGEQHARLVQRAATGGLAFAIEEMRNLDQSKVLSLICRLAESYRVVNNWRLTLSCLDQAYLTLQKIILNYDFDLQSPDVAYSALLEYCYESLFADAPERSLNAITEFLPILRKYETELKRSNVVWCIDEVIKMAEENATYLAKNNREIEQLGTVLINTQP